MLSWGVAIARRLGIVDDLIRAGAQPAPLFNIYAMGQQTEARPRVGRLHRREGSRLPPHRRHPHEGVSLRGAMIPAAWLDGAKVAGPLAEFEGADHWLPSPAKDGFALIGDAALTTYATNHDDYYKKLHDILGAMTFLFWSPGPEADARRQKVFGKMKENPMAGWPDAAGLGPFGPADEKACDMLRGICLD